MRVVLWYVAEIVTLVVEATVFVVIEKPTLVLPDGIVTVAGKVATEGLLLLSTIWMPPDGAGFDTETVPADAVPPVTEFGVSRSPLIVQLVVGTH